MKRSLITIGRFGTVVIFVSIAILIASAFGPVTYNVGTSQGRVPADSFNVLQGPLFNSNPTFPTLVNVSPQNNAKVSINSTYYLIVYLIEGNRSVIEKWIKTNHPEQPANTSFSPKNTILEEFLQANPSLILWHGQGTNVKFGYMPTEIMNLTVIVSNPNAYTANISYSVNVEYGFASISTMRYVAIGLLPIGVVFALPWATQRVKQRRRK